ncbi:MAG: tmk [Chlamydiales bacterium]|jgi:dTMP kinase|nr:tmk [Chlamydiales bacterium]
MRKRGALVTFEGGEGAGKTTLIASLYEALQAKGVLVIKTREPGGSPLGEEIRSWLLRTDGAIASEKTELLLFLAARAEHIKRTIEPALEAGALVLCDRFNDSTVAYQGAGRGLGEKEVRSICNFVSGDVQPQLTFYLDIDPRSGLERARRSRAEGLDRLEEEELSFHREVRASFQRMKEQEPARFLQLDAEKPADALVQEALSHLETFWS